MPAGEAALAAPEAVHEIQGVHEVLRNRHGAPVPFRRFRVAIRTSYASGSTSHSRTPSASDTRHSIIARVRARVWTEGFGWVRTAARKRSRSPVVRCLRPRASTRLKVFSVTQGKLPYARGTGQDSEPSRALGARLAGDRGGRNAADVPECRFGNTTQDSGRTKWCFRRERFDVYVHDVRNHGRNPVGDRDRLLHNVVQFAEDFECVARSIDGRLGKRKPRIGVFHSLSAIVALHHAAAGGEYAALVLFDPPVCPPGGHAFDIDGVGARLSEMTLKRQERFDSPAELAKSLSRSPLFERVPADVLDLITRTTVRSTTKGGGYELRCPRALEAQVYAYFFVWLMMLELETVSCPLKVIGSDLTVRNSFMPSMSLTELVALEYDFVPDASHFLQFEQPEECARRTLDFLARHDLCP